MITGRTTAEIYSSIIDEIRNSTALINLAPQIDSQQTLLSDLAKTSKVASWRQYAWNIAYIISVFEKNLENFYDVIDDLVKKNFIGTARWLTEQAKKFQDGDTIVWNELESLFEYEVVDEDKQIITGAAVEELGNKVILKVKKATSKLSNAEFERFNSYINTIKMIGTTIEIRNVDWDQLILNIDVMYNGEKEKSALQTLVEASINDYINNLDFNTTLKASEIVDRIQAIDGVLDVHFKKSSGIPIVGPSVDWTYTYTTYAGAAKISLSNPLSSTINYIPTKEY